MIKILHSFTHPCVSHADIELVQKGQTTLIK